MDEPPRAPAGRRQSGTLTSPPAAACWSQTFPATARHARDARHFLAGILDGHPATSDAIVCLSELVTNAVLHSASAGPGGTYRLRAVLGPQTVHVEVEDDGGPWQPASHPDSQGGRGLAIVSTLAHEWGITADREASRTVWFEIYMRP